MDVDPTVSRREIGTPTSPTQKKGSQEKGPQEKALAGAFSAYCATLLMSMLSNSSMSQLPGAGPMSAVL